MRAKMNPMREALLIRCTADNDTLVAVFGNDNYGADDKARREVAMVRQAPRANLQELAFRAQPRHLALLARTDGSCYQTEIARRFQVEMLKVYLDDIVWRAWWTACGVAPDSAERLTRDSSNTAE